MKRVRLNQQLFESRCAEKHNGKYDYSKTMFTKSHDTVTVLCPLHGEFTIKAYSHLQGVGCAKCGIERVVKKRRLPLSEILKRAREVHGNKYDYTQCTITNFQPVCRLHGVFKQSYKAHCNGQGCPKCNVGGKLSTASFVKRCQQYHGDKYDYSCTVYEGFKNQVMINCPSHGVFSQLPEVHLRGSGCPKCANSGVSDVEKEVFSLVNTLVPDAVHSYRKLIAPKEVDIYIPSKNIAIEFNGLYWHSEEFHDKKYHIGKRLAVEAQSCRLISIREDLWNERQSQVIRIIKNALGVSSDRIGARQTIVVEINGKEVKAFMDENHVQGYRNATVHFALQRNGVLVAVLSLTYWKTRSQWEVTRYATAYTVSGGLSRLWKHAVKTLNITSAYTYIDRDLFTGDAYVAIGFKRVNSTVGFRVITKGTTESRQKWNSAPVGMTQSQWYAAEGVKRIYDSGQDKLIFKA